jgi:hypothetical protein
MPFLRIIVNFNNHLRSLQVASNESILCVYADSQAIADALLAKYLAQTKVGTVSFLKDKEDLLYPPL